MSQISARKGVFWLTLATRGRRTAARRRPRNRRRTLGRPRSSPPRVRVRGVLQCVSSVCRGRTAVRPAARRQSRDRPRLPFAAVRSRRRCIRLSGSSAPASPPPVKAVAVAARARCRPAAVAQLDRQVLPPDVTRPAVDHPSQEGAQQRPVGDERNEVDLFVDRLVPASHPVRLDSDAAQQPAPDRIRIRSGGDQACSTTDRSRTPSQAGQRCSYTTRLPDTYGTRARPASSGWTVSRCSTSNYCARTRSIGYGIRLW